MSVRPRCRVVFYEIRGVSAKVQQAIGSSSKGESVFNLRCKAKASQRLYNSPQIIRIVDINGIHVLLVSGILQVRQLLNPKHRFEKRWNDGLLGLPDMLNQHEHEESHLSSLFARLHVVVRNQVEYVFRVPFQLKAETFKK